MPVSGSTMPIFTVVSLRAAMIGGAARAAAEACSKPRRPIPIEILVCILDIPLPGCLCPHSLTRAGWRFALIPVRACLVESENRVAPNPAKSTLPQQTGAIWLPSVPASRESSPCYGVPAGESWLQTLLWPARYASAAPCRTLEYCHSARCVGPDQRTARLSDSPTATTPQWSRLWFWPRSGGRRDSHVSLPEAVWPTVLLLLVYAAAVSVRMPQILLKGRFWAEEGAIYFLNGRNLSCTCLDSRPYGVSEPGCQHRNIAGRSPCPD